MNLQQLIRIMERVALKQLTVQTVVENDVFRLNSLPNVRYGVFAWLQRNHRGSVTGPMQTFSFSLFYVDRLRQDERNQVEVQSVGIDTMGNILRTLSEVYDVEVDEYTITTFNQRFADQCAGAFANVTLRVPADYVCADNPMGDFNEDFSDDFWTAVL